MLPPCVILSKLERPEGSEGASKDPENVSSAMPIQGVLTKSVLLLQRAVIAQVLLDR